MSPAIVPLTSSKVDFPCATAFATASSSSPTNGKCAIIEVKKAALALVNSASCNMALREPVSPVHPLDGNSSVNPCFATSVAGCAAGGVLVLYGRFPRRYQCIATFPLLGYSFNNDEVVSAST